MDGRPSIEGLGYYGKREESENKRCGRNASIQKIPRSSERFSGGAGVLHHRWTARFISRSVSPSEATPTGAPGTATAGDDSTDKKEEQEKEEQTDDTTGFAPRRPPSQGLP